MGMEIPVITLRTSDGALPATSDAWRADRAMGNGIRAGDIDALATAFRAYGGFLRGAAAWVRGEHADAAVVEGFASLWRERDTAPDEPVLALLVRRIGVHLGDHADWPGAVATAAAAHGFTVNDLGALLGLASRDVASRITRVLQSHPG